MQRYQDILGRVQLLAGAAIPWSGTLYRSSIVQHANQADFLAGEGSRRFGGRWNPKGLAAVYASLTPKRALAEALSHYRYYGFDVADAMPRVFVAIDVTLERVVDLTEGQVRRRLGISLQRMLADDWRKLQQMGVVSLAQMIGQAAVKVGLQGLLVPCSLQPIEKNLVWFPKNLSGNLHISIRKRDELPR